MERKNTDSFLFKRFSLKVKFEKGSMSQNRKGINRSYLLFPIKSTRISKPSHKVVSRKPSFPLYVYPSVKSFLCCGNGEEKIEESEREGSI